MASSEEITYVVAELIKARMACGQASISIAEVASMAQGMVIGESRHSLEKKIRELAATPGSLIGMREDTVFVSEPQGELLLTPHS